MEQRWKKTFEEVKKDSSSQAMWSLMQQQIEQLRVQMSGGLNRNILLLTKPQRGVNEQLRRITEQVNRQLMDDSGKIRKRLECKKTIGQIQF
jgi:hypothetical protein